MFFGDVYVIQQRWWVVGRIGVDQNRCSCSLRGRSVHASDTANAHVGRSSDIKVPVVEDFNGNFYTLASLHFMT